MWGPSALQCTGTMLRWTGHKQLGDVRVPTYAFAMEHDTVDPAVLSKVWRSGEEGTGLVFADAFYSALYIVVSAVAASAHLVSVAVRFVLCIRMLIFCIAVGHSRVVR